MKILQSNTGEEEIYVLKQHLYVSVTDFNFKCFLKEVKIGPGQHSWEWVPFRTDRCLDISEIDDRYCTFENAINRAVNNSYLTVYEFNSFEDLIMKWGDVRYVDSIKTIYKSKQEKTDKI